MFFANKEYENNVLEPHLSRETLEYHFEKHHKGYADTLNNLVKGTDLEFLSLKEVISRKDQIDIKIYNNASQVFNHNFYWKSMSPNKKNPSDDILAMIEKTFGTVIDFYDAYINFASQMFGSGWSWLVIDNDKMMSFLNTSNADSPTIFNKTPILVVDLWEHAYYIDYRNNRKAYIEEIVKKCLDFDFANDNLAI